MPGNLNDSTAVRITLVGDYFIGQGFSPIEERAIKTFIEERDLVVLNYEGSLPGGAARRKPVTLGMTKESLQLPDGCVLSLANNHVLDYGPDGLCRTIDAIEASRLHWFGLETRRGRGDNYTIREQSGCRICLAGFGWRNEECVPASRVSAGVVNFTKANIDRLFARLATERYDHLIVYVHFGYEHEYYPLPLHVGLSRYLVERGAAMVYGSHSHCIQPYEVYAGRHIFYGLGNFIFSPGHEKYPAQSDRGLIVHVKASKTALDVEGVDRIDYSRTDACVAIGPDREYLDEAGLGVSDLRVYGTMYGRLRRRKRNPRPIMQFGRPIANELKYYMWFSAVRVTGKLGIRQTVKKILGWA